MYAEDGVMNDSSSFFLTYRSILFLTALGIFFLVGARGGGGKDLANEGYVGSSSDDSSLEELEVLGSRKG